MNAFLGVFLDEACDTLEQWRELIDELRLRGTCDFNALFRCAHNIKGSSRSVGLVSYGAFVHEVEQLITALRDGTRPIDEDAVDALERARALLDSWGALLRSGDDTGVPSNEAGLKTHIKELSRPRQGDTSDNALPPALQCDEVVTSAAQGGAGDDGIFWAIDPTPVAAIAAPTPATLAAPFVVESANEPSKEPPKELSKDEVKRSGPTLEESIRVPRGRLEEITRSVSELTLGLGSLPSDIRTRTELVPLLAAVRDLQEKALGLVVAPVTPLFDWLSGVASDVARKVGKEIEVNLAGGDTEIDKRVLERMKDPLMHIVRNAVDHGLETATDRVASGKGPGRVRISARKRATSVVIEVSDDGRGMDPAVLKRKAVDKGLIAPDARLTDPQCLELVFLPGFSTAASVSDISGRGVGMDVVRQAVTSLRGEIRIDSVCGAGSTFTMTFPTDVSIVDALIVRAGNIDVGVPSEQVESVRSLDDLPVESRRGGMRLVQMDGECVPLQSLRALLGAKQGDTTPFGGGRQAVLLVRTKNGVFGLEVDAILGKRPLAVRSATSRYQRRPGIQAVSIFDDGRPGILLDLEGLLRQAAEWNQPLADVRIVAIQREAS